MVEATQTKKEFKPATKDEEETVELLTLKSRQRASPFLNKSRSWTDEDHFQIPPEILKGITEELGFLLPSYIQGVAIPMIIRAHEGEYVNLIAQSKNGSGKTGAFAIGSVLRVDPKIPKIQVLVICHIRELSAQIAEVYKKITKFSDIKVSDYTATENPNAQIVVTTLGKLHKSLSGRKQIFDLSELRCVVIDEVDFFFTNNPQNRDNILDINNRYLVKLPNKFQWILFSATFPQDAQEIIYEFCKDAASIALKKERLQLDHIQQYEYRCEPKKKIDFVMKVFDVCALTQAIIFVNTKQFCEFVQNTLRRHGFKSTIMFSEMTHEERDEMMQKFRNQQVNVIITTNMLARGIDVPEIEIVINFDVPTSIALGKKQGDPESYLHRIGRTGRFGSKGLAVTIYDRDEDKQYLDQIMAHYAMESKLNKLEGPAHLNQLFQSLHKI